MKYLILGAFYLHVGIKLLNLRTSFIDGADKTYLDGAYAAQQLGYTFLLFVFQHPIFIAARFVLFLITQIFCCGCPCIDEDVTELHAFELDGTDDCFADRVLLALTLRNTRFKQADSINETTQKRENSSGTCTG